MLPGARKRPRSLLYEHRTEPMLSRREFGLRLWRHFLVAQLLVLASLLVGMFGYHQLAHFSWIDSFLNAAMLLGGMGPVGEIPSSGGQAFAGIYALYAGLVLIAVSAVLLTPVIHRVMHSIHLEVGGDQGDEPPAHPRQR
ncbi:MAG: hypothetical protein ABUL71_01735 [Gemmatimonadota bacterium]